MATVKLAEYMRESIEKKLLQHAFSEKAQTLAAEFAGLAVKVYNDVLDARQRAMLAELPAGWVPEVNQITVQFGEEGRSFTQLYFSGTGGWRGFSEVVPSDVKSGRPEVSLRVPYKYGSGAAKVYDRVHPLGEEWRHLEEKREFLGQEVAEARKKIRATLGSVSTLSALLKVWPEVGPFVQHLASKPAPQLPAVPRGELNFLLDLPVGEAS